ncbi:hypothetical protein WL51_13725 [Burkholderia ubonensis]|nr:hypothetical protein WJ74_09395 [Burkholderia ubonensis]KWC38511.1 hypothetical protein WL51_13725 [Burkholderia ubonensis]
MTIGNLDHDFLKIGETRNRDPQLFEVSERTSQPRAFVCVVEDVAAGYGCGVGRGNAEHIVEARIMRMIFDSMQRGFYTATAAKVPDDFIMDGDDVIEVEQVSDPSMRSARLDARK